MIGINNRSIKTAVVIFALFFLPSCVNDAENKKEKMLNEFSITAPAKDNYGLYRDVSAFKAGEKYYIVLPAACDFSGIGISVKNKNNIEILNESFDFYNADEAVFCIEGESFSVKALKTRLPVMYIDTIDKYGTVEEMNMSPDHSVSCYGDMHMEVPANIAERLGCETEYDTAGADHDKKTPGSVSIRGRGNSSWKTVTNKQRPYRLKLENEADLLGLGKGKIWALLRSENHTTYLNNKICYDMAHEMGIRYTPRCEMTDVFLNGEYIGMYTLSKTVEVGENSIPITDMDKARKKGDPDITGGYLIEMDNNPDDIQFSSCGNTITLKSPEKKSYSASDKEIKYINALTDDIFGAIYADGKLNDGRDYSEVFDVESAARYVLFCELTGNYDCTQGSTFLYKDKDSIDKKVYMGPVWDCDKAFIFCMEEWCIPFRVSYHDRHELLANALCRHKDFTDEMCRLYYGENEGEKIKDIFRSYILKEQDYEDMYERSASLTSIRYEMLDPDFSHIGVYIEKKADFMDKALKELSGYVLNEEKRKEYEKH